MRNSLHFHLCSFWRGRLARLQNDGAGIGRSGCDCRERAMDRAEIVEEVTMVRHEQLREHPVLPVLDEEGCEELAGSDILRVPDGGRHLHSMEETLEAVGSPVRTVAAEVIDDLGLEEVECFEGAPVLRPDAVQDVNLPGEHQLDDVVRCAALGGSQVEVAREVSEAAVDIEELRGPHGDVENLCKDDAAVAVRGG